MILARALISLALLNSYVQSDGATDDFEPSQQVYKFELVPGTTEFSTTMDPYNVSNTAASANEELIVEEGPIKDESISQKEIAVGPNGGTFVIGKLFQVGASAEVFTEPNKSKTSSLKIVDSFVVGQQTSKESAEEENEFKKDAQVQTSMNASSLKKPQVSKSEAVLTSMHAAIKDEDEAIDEKSESTGIAPSLWSSIQGFFNKDENPEILTSMQYSSKKADPETTSTEKNVSNEVFKFFFTDGPVFPAVPEGSSIFERLQSDWKPLEKQPAEVQVNSPQRKRESPYFQKHQSHYPPPANFYGPPPKDDSVQPTQAEVVYYAQQNREVYSNVHTSFPSATPPPSINPNIAILRPVPKYISHYGKKPKKENLLKNLFKPKRKRAKRPKKTYNYGGIQTSG